MALHLPLLRAGKVYLEGPNTGVSMKPFEKFLSKCEKDYLIAVLKETKGNVSEAITVSGLARTRLYRKLKKYKIDPRSFRGE